MRCRLLGIVTLFLLLLPFAGCGDDGPAKNADAGPEDVTYIEGPVTSKIHDLNPYLEQWIPVKDAATDVTADLATDAGGQE